MSKKGQKRGGRLGIGGTAKKAVFDKNPLSPYDEQEKCPKRGHFRGFQGFPILRILMILTKIYVI